MITVASVYIYTDLATGFGDISLSVLLVSVF